MSGRSGNKRGAPRAIDARTRELTEPPEVRRRDGSSTQEQLPAFPAEVSQGGVAEFERRRTTNVTRPPGELGNRQAVLSVLAGPQEGNLHKLALDGRMVMGRDHDCEILIDDDGVSRKHAAVEQIGEKVFLEDLGSRNGTYLGHSKVDRQELVSDDLIRIGGATIIKFSWMAETEEEHHERLKSAALRDGLTGLYNRRHFDECCVTECAASHRHGKPLSLLVLDVDNFKKINDTHGHQAGDQVLHQVASELLDCARREDLVFRHGGEEFAVLAGETDLRGALRLAERIRRQLSRLRLRTKRDESISVTASIGVAQLEAKEDPERLVKRADEAMYSAKRKGKDQVVGSAPSFPGAD